ncbi:MAG: undecaprenyldiphospho-muramoylpentapeptide beta-N-acetylglucosaminyltransferase [Armatimonadota bacterium]|jgi:UDP-N-acetylglucosamine--N-acetylmuramyl-(pentapeptide) pyrophosphoryl-undecaprenol N-acetylglucosamine transferase
MSGTRVLMAGGGTAGHLFPAVAVAEELQAVDPSVECRFIGASGRIDAELLAARGLPHDLIDAKPMPYGVSAAALAGLAGLVRGIRQTRAIIRRFEPDVMFNTGGYVGAAAGIAARTLGVPLILHASDVLPDRANRLLARWARAVTCVSPAAAAEFGEVAVVTGHPIRREVADATAEAGMSALGLEAGLPMLLVTGGSQGARRLNMAVIGALRELLEEVGVQIVHLSGSLDHAYLRDEAERMGAPARYHLIEHLPNAGLALAAADLVITRAGAASLAEACLHGLPMVVVPYPHAGGHQRRNAEPLAEDGAAIIVEDERFTAERLLSAVREVLSDDDRRREMADAAQAAAKPGAARDVADMVLQVANAAALAEQGAGA